MVERGMDVRTNTRIVNCVCSVYAAVKKGSDARFAISAMQHREQSRAEQREENDVTLTQTDSHRPSCALNSLDSRV